MKHTIISTLIALGASICVTNAQVVDTDNRFMRPFTENFNTASPEFFNMGSSSKVMRYYPGVPSLSEKGTDVMVMRIDPATQAGAGRGPEISSKKLTHFGTYTARIRVPDVKEVQPNIGSVVGYFTYRVDKDFGLSEIDFEWLIADPTIIYIGTWTSAPGDAGKLQRVGRTIKLDTGRIYNTLYRSYHDGNRNHNFTDDASTSPKTVPAIEGYNASKHFYVYGFDWYPERLTWWIEHPETGEKIILWDYQGTTPNFSGIPQSPTTHLLNFWHTNDWSVETNPKSLEKPAYPYGLEVDWMKYEPYDEINIEWRKKNNW